MGWLSKFSDKLKGTPAPQASAGDDYGGYGGPLVPAGTTIGQILDYVGGSGETWPLDFYGFGAGISRNSAVTYAPLYRTVTLIAHVVSGLITEGTLSVVDQDGRRRTGRRVDRVMEALTWSPDGGDTPASQVIADAMCDYLLDGNALMVPSFDSQGYVTGMRRMLPWDSDIEYGKNGGKMYRLSPVEKRGGAVTEYHAAMDVLHARWPLVLRYGRSRSTREGFAIAPVVALRPALSIGLHGDRYIQRWFQRGAQGKLHVDHEIPDGTARPTPEQLAELRDWVHRSVGSQKPLVTVGAKSAMISDTPQDREAGKLREHQAQEVAAAYGVPAPLIGVLVTEWGTGLQQLSRQFYKWCISQHVSAFLAPFRLRLLAKGDRFLVDPTDLLRGDPDEIAKLITAIQGDSQRAPVATRTELRRIAGLTTDPIGEFAAPPVQPERAPGMAAANGHLTRTNGIGAQ